MSLKGKTALITGSTSGIGFGIAKGFAEAGINIIINGFGDNAQINENKKILESFGVQALYSPADMTDPKQIKEMIDNSIEELGSIDILVNNAGIQNVSPVEDFPDDKWQAIIDINLSSNFHTVKHALKHMKKNKWGRIINIASAHGLVASPFKSAYVSAKHGVIGFTKTIALEVAEENITCNAICPGYVLTDLVKNQIKDTAKARNMSEDDVINKIMLSAQWTKKFVTVQQLSGVALFLCSNHADNITGASIPVDGGWTAS